MIPAIWTVFIALAAASPTRRQVPDSSDTSSHVDPDYATVTFYDDLSCVDAIDVEYPASNLVVPAPQGGTSLSFDDLKCVSDYCLETDGPTLLACSDIDCTSYVVVNVGDCVSSTHGLYAFWQHESLDGGDDSGNVSGEGVGSQSGSAISAQNGGAGGAQSGSAGGNPPVIVV